MAKRLRDIVHTVDVNTRAKAEAQLAVDAMSASRSLRAVEHLDDVEAARRVKMALLSIALNEEAMESSRIAAIDKWLDRVVGKPIQMSVVQVSDGDRVRKALDEVKRREVELGYVVDMQD